MYPRLIYSILIGVLVCFVNCSIARAADTPYKAEDSILAYAEMYAFGATDNFSATGLSQEQGNQIITEFNQKLLETFKDYPLSKQNLSAIQSKYLSKLQTIMNLKTKIKKKNKNNPIVEVSATTVNANLARLASNNENLLALGYELRQRQNEGATISDLKTDSQFQNVAFKAISDFIDRLPLNQVKTFDVQCRIIEGYDGKNYYAPEDPDALKNFLITDFVVDVNDGQEKFEQFFGFVLNPTEDTHQIPQFTYNKNDSWLIYWYICGTDLESKWEQATNDINEALKVKLPPNVKILIQTGTTSKWHHEIVDIDARYLYDNTGLKKISNHTAKMYDSQTLKNFLVYGDKKYKPDHRILIFWDHGGVGGICQDKEDTKESMSFNAIRIALEEIYGKSPVKTPFEIIGFDTCSMASYESAKTIEGFAKYMVASEAPENGFGWYYTDWLNLLAEHPESNGAVLGEKICSSSLEDCKRHNDSNESTFSVVDISKLDRLYVAHQKFFTEALNRSKDSGQFSTRFDRMAKNVPMKQYNNAYIDLKVLAEGSKNFMPDAADDLITAVSDVVVGKPSNGALYRESGGISTYYPYDSESHSYYKAQDVALQEQKDFYDILLRMNAEKTGNDSDNSDNSNAPRNKRSTVKNNFPLNDVPVYIDENKHIYTQLTPEQLEMVSSVRCIVMPSIEFANSEMGVKDNAVVLLGNDVDFKGNWQEGIFHDNFRNVWASIDGHLIFMSVTFSNSEYNVYEVPIKLNGEIRTLEISYSYSDKKYSLLGAREKMKRGISSRDKKYIKKGDEITPLFIVYASSESLDADDNQTIIEDESGITKITEGVPFIVGEDPIVEDKTLGNGKYGYCFQFFGPGETFLGISQRALFTIENGEIIDTVLVEDHTQNNDENIDENDE